MKHDSSVHYMFWRKVEFMAGGCWERAGALTSKGYTKFGMGERTQYSHRFAYEQIKGPIPLGLTLDHLCRNTRCCNPYHLEAVDLWTNQARGIGFCAKNSKKTHCKFGHLLDARNVYFRPFNGARRSARTCRTCQRNRYLAKKIK
jgi:hypothetical protein